MIFMWHNHIPQLNIQVLVSSDNRPYRKLTFHPVLARQNYSYYNGARLNFRAFALRDMKTAARKGCRAGYRFNLVFAYLTVLALEEAFILLCPWSIKHFFFDFIAKLSDRCFCYFTAAMFVPLRRAQTWRLHTKLYKFGRHISVNNVRMKKKAETWFLARCLYINHLLYPKFLTFFIEWLRFLVLITWPVKTENRVKIPDEPELAGSRARVASRRFKCRISECWTRRTTTDCETL